jgi:ABC-type multidrug transport system, ATPase and permease components
MVLLTSVTIFIGSLEAARILHAISLSNILKCPMAFFDVTPVGRVLNRFSKDVDTMDNRLSMIFKIWIARFYGVCILSILPMNNDQKIFIFCEFMKIPQLLCT